MECVSAIVFLLLSFVSISWCNEYYVLSQNKADCPDGSQCNDLNYYASQSEIYFTSDTTLTFLEGTHILDQDGPIIVSGVSNLTLRGLTPNTSTIEQHAATVIINCSRSNSGFLMNDFNDITLSGLSITDCGFRLPEEMKLFITSRYSVTRYNWEYVSSVNAFFSVLLFNGTNVIIDKFSVENGTGYGLTAINVYSVDMTSSSFSGNNIYCHGFSETTQGGNIRFAYIESTRCPSGVNSSSVISVRNVSTTNSQNCGRYKQQYYKAYEYPGKGAGLAVFRTSLSCSNVQFNIDSVNATNNTASVGANVLIMGFPITFNVNNLNCSDGFSSYLGSGFLVLLILTAPDHHSTELIITNSVFIDNNGISDFNVGLGVAFYLLAYNSKFYNYILLESCYFSENKGYSVLHLIKVNYVDTEMLRVNLNNVQLYNNGVTVTNSVNFAGALVLINCVCHATDLSVSNSPYTGIQMLESSLTFTGNNLIQNNSYTNGGGMSLLGYSTIIFQPPTVVNFTNNHADEYGGAIYVPVNIEKTFVGPCFFQIDDVSQSPKPDVVINAINNTATTTGTLLSGGDLSVCYLVGNRTDSYSRQPAYNLFTSFIQPAIDLKKVSFISSVPVSATFCFSNGTYNPRIRPQLLGGDIFQGKSINISIVSTSDTQGYAPGNVTVTFYNCTYNCSRKGITKLSSRQYITDTLCGNITIVLKGNEYSTHFLVEVAPPKTVYYLPRSTLYILFTSVDCPPGFSKREYCECNDDITSVGGTCDINSTTITTNGSVWISYDNTSNCTLYSSNCPNDFCIERRVSFNIFEPDLQCRSGRTGRLCGECADGYSLLLGSDECGRCPNNNFLSLLIVFIIAGILLVVLLIALNLTVSVGTINGLIFYANIVKINEDIFFPSNSSDPLILRQFISFLNLDFGLKTCFYNGMTAYIKAWLQFAFPLYIWFIMIVIMLLSSRFTKLSSLIGNNAVKVFATLLLLSYTKIIRAIGVTLSLTLLRCDTVELYVWKYDGAIAYGSSEHLILVTFSVLFLVCLVLPYTLILIGLPVIDRFFTLIRCQRCFRWLKPFTDAYSGPFKDKHTFWFGLLIIARIILTIVKNISKDDISLSLTAFIIMLLLALGLDFEGPYKTTALNVLESWFLINLFGLSIMGFQSDKIAMTSAVVSVSLVLMSFIAIIIYHIHWLYLNNISEKLKCCLLKKSKREDSIMDSVLSIDTGREPLINYDDESNEKVGTKVMRGGGKPRDNGGKPQDGGINVILSANHRTASFSRYRDSILEHFD